MIDRAGQQLAGIREPAHQIVAGTHPVQGDATQVPDARREHQPSELEQREDGQGLAMRIGRMFGDRQRGAVAEDLIEDMGTKATKADRTCVAQ